MALFEKREEAVGEVAGQRRQLLEVQGMGARWAGRGGVALRGPPVCSAALTAWGAAPLRQPDW